MPTDTSTSSAARPTKAWLKGGETALIYYNNFNASNPFSTYPNPHDMAVAIQSYVNANWSLGPKWLDLR